MTPYFNSKIQPTEQLLQLKMVEGVYVLLNTDKNLYASIFDFTRSMEDRHTGIYGAGIT